MTVDPARSRGHPMLGPLVIAGLCLVAGSACVVDSGADAAAATGSASAPARIVADPEAAGSLNGPLEPELGLWIDGHELAALPTSGAAWERLRDYADAGVEMPLIDVNSSHADVQTLANALVAARTGDRDRAALVATALDLVQEQAPTTVLAPARNVPGFVVAADLIGYRTPEFEAWLADLVDRPLDGRAGIESLRDSAMRDPSNHGTHARASILLIALYLDDHELSTAVVERFHDWLGRSAAGFVWGERSWHADRSEPRGVNPPGSTIEGVDVDGVLPDDQRRSGPFAAPPLPENYVWEALQGAAVTAAVLERQGLDAWGWQDRALLRAYSWLHRVVDYPAAGDDAWQAWLVNDAYGTAFPAAADTRPGKNMGFTSWTHGR